MSLEVDVQAAYEAQEAAETAARDLEARIRRIRGAARLLPPRQYGQPLNRDAIAKSLTLRSLIAKEDRHLAAYLGISVDTRQADAEAEAAQMQAERLRLETQRLREQNESAARARAWNLMNGRRPDGRGFY